MQHIILIISYALIMRIKGGFLKQNTRIKHGGKIISTVLAGLVYGLADSLTLVGPAEYEFQNFNTVLAIQLSMAFALVNIGLGGYVGSMMTNSKNFMVEFEPIDKILKPVTNPCLWGVLGLVLHGLITFYAFMLIDFSFWILFFSCVTMPIWYFTGHKIRQCLEDKSVVAWDFGELLYGAAIGLALSYTL